MRILILLLFLAGCSGSDRPLQFNLGSEAVQLDWTRSIDSTSAVVLDNIMEGLTSYVDSLPTSDAELLRPMPALAYSWSVSEGGKVYHFHLRSRVYWSDGVELTAQHFVDSWERLLNPATESTNSYQLREIVNASDYSSGKIKDFSQVGVKALDKLTLEVRLRRAVPYFLHLVASPATFPIRKDLVQRYGDQWVDPENIVTLGPYRVNQWVQGEKIVLKVFPGYHGNRPKISTVICRLVAEPLTAYALYENGDLDIIPRDLPPSYARNLQTHPDYRSGAKLSVTYLLLNIARPAFRQASARRAFIRALSRPELTAFFEGSQTPVSSWIPPGLVGFNPKLGIQAEGIPTTQVKAAPLVLRFSGNDTWNLVMQEIQRMMAEKMAVKAKLEPMGSQDFNKFLNELTSRRGPTSRLPDVIQLSWVADYPDPHSFMNIFTSTSENNYMGWKNARYDALVEEAVANTDENSRRKIYLEAQRLLLEEEAVLMPLFLNSHQALVRSELHGVHLNVLDKWYFQNVEFTGDGWSGFSRNVWRRIRGSRSLGPGSS